VYPLNIFYKINLSRFCQKVLLLFYYRVEHQFYFTLVLFLIFIFQAILFFYFAFTAFHAFFKHVWLIF